MLSNYIDTDFKKISILTDNNANLWVISNNNNNNNNTTTSTNYF